MEMEYIAVFQRDIGVSDDIMATYLFRFNRIFTPIITSARLIPFEYFICEEFEDWFSPTEGLKTIRRCLEYLRQNLKHSKAYRFWWLRLRISTDVMTFIRELEEIEGALVAAEKQGVYFYFRDKNWDERLRDFVVQSGDEGYELPTDPPDENDFQETFS
jgi:hypothetical protein